MRWWQKTVAAGAVVSFLLLAGPTLAQSPDPSPVSELWTDVGVNLELSDRARATFTQTFRFDESMSRHYFSAPELALRYELLGWWQLEAGYRYEYERDNDAVFQDRSRIFASTRFSTKFRPATLELRLQWQKESRSEQDDGTPTRHHMRTRMRAKLRRIPTVNPYASVEMFHRLDGSDEDVPAGTFQKWRLGLGVEWQRGPVELDACYYLVSPTHDPQDPTRHVLTLGLRFDLGFWKKSNDKD